MVGDVGQLAGYFGIDIRLVSYPFWTCATMNTTISERSTTSKLVRMYRRASIPYFRKARNAHMKTGYLVHEGIAKLTNLRYRKADCSVFCDIECSNTRGTEVSRSNHYI